MDVREKLIELLSDSEYMSFEKKADYLIANGVTVRTADNLSANGVKAQQWIPVTERLPREFISVLVYIPSEAPLPTVHEGYYVEKDECWMVHICGSVCTAVTHWMPLPEPPKEIET